MMITIDEHMFSMLSNIIHERIQCALSRCVLKKSLYHKYCSWKVSFFHELLLCAHSFSSKTFLTNVKLESKMASFLHELMLYDCSNLSFFVNLASQTSHLKSFFTSCCLVSIQVSFSWKIGITNITLETFLSFMKCCYVLIQFFLSLKTSITHAALERLLSFMNWWNLSIQRGLLCKTCITNVAFERLPSFMN